MDDLNRNLGFLLHDVARLMRKRFEQNARDLGLTRSQCQVLAHLARNEGIHQGALAELLEIEPITLTRILDRLEEGGLVERLRHPQERRTLRRVLLALGPIVVLAGGLFAYTAGGRYVSTDNAYVHAGKLTVATDVSGIVADVAVKESQTVEKGQVLFTLDQEPFRIALAGAEANLGIVRNQLVTLQATWRQKQAQVAQAKTDVAFYETGFQRQQDLLKRGVASQAAYDQAKRDLDAAHERVIMAQNDADSTLAQLGGKADAPIEQNANYLAAQAQVDKA